MQICCMNLRKKRQFTKTNVKSVRRKSREMKGHCKFCEKTLRSFCFCYKGDQENNYRKKY